jgi:DNA repair protein RAD51
LHLLEEVETMSAEEVQSQSAYEDGLGGPGAPTPVSALEVRFSFVSLASFQADILQGINGLTPRDIKLMVDAGYNTVESVAYTYDCLRLKR